MSGTEGKRSPFPTKEAIFMLSRAGKSTTAQYLAFQKIEAEGTEGRVEKKTGNEEEAVKGFLNNQGG